MKNTVKAKPYGFEMIENKMKDYMGKRSFCNITGRGRVEICGCCGLVTYKDDLVEIVLCDSFISIKGECLTIKNYYGGRMIITGEIDVIEYGNIGGGGI